MQITTVLSDYDGTLCSTASIRTRDSKIPKMLEEMLWSISEKLPTCIISSKDFAFLHERTKFAHILACVLGTEIISHKYHNDNKISGTNCITLRHLIASHQLLTDNSRLLRNVREILKNQKDITLEEKYTSDKEILIGLTIDYRHLENWQSFKDNTEPILRETVQRNVSANLGRNLSSRDLPFIQMYSSHPFLDIYGIKCDKGLAFDNILSQLDRKKAEIKSVMYLGDSENDNPAFEKAGVSIGVRSDERLNPKLNCKYTINFNDLPAFLNRLYENNFVFSESLLEKIKRN
ncbi:MAG: HAD-IIB family hydrolase [Nitrososphaeraceae archaeon]